MRIGRLAFGIAAGGSWWGFEKASCDCMMLDLGKLYITWLSKTCKCQACNKYECVCEEFP